MTLHHFIQESTNAMLIANGTTPKSAAGIDWDLSVLFVAHDDSRIGQSLSELTKRAEAFDKTYRGTINVAGGPDVEHLLDGLTEAESMLDQAYRLSAYAHLLYAADTSKDEHRALVQRIDEALTAFQNQTLFFELEWRALNAADAERVASHPALATYKHYLQAERRFAPHTLSEAEEKLMNDKDLTGIGAWQKLFTEFSFSSASLRVCGAKRRSACK